MRSREQMSADAAIALRSDLSRGGGHSVPQAIMWAWTGFHGEFVGCPDWTPDAIAGHTASPRGLAKRLGHEHAVPRGVAIAAPFDMSDPDQEQAHALLERTLFGVVVTRAEDRVLGVPFRRSMPRKSHDPGDPAHFDPWLRYRRRGLAVIDRTRGEAIVVGPTPPRPA